MWTWGITTFASTFDGGRTLDGALGRIAPHHMTWVSSSRVQLNLTIICFSHVVMRGPFVAGSRERLSMCVYIPRLSSAGSFEASDDFSNVAKVSENSAHTEKSYKYEALHTEGGGWESCVGRLLTVMFLGLFKKWTSQLLVSASCVFYSVFLCTLLLSIMHQPTEAPNLFRRKR